jgi:dihydrolipoamide dehydrogenase
MEKEVDVAIVGAGSAGLSALREVRKVTENFVVIHDGPHGTTCARVGCMPSKLFIQAAETFYERHHFSVRGIHGGESLTVVFAELMRYVREWRDFFVEDVLETVEKLGDRLLTGRPEFKGPGVLRVGKREIRAKSVILATGTRPKVPQEWLGFRKLLLTTDQFFELEDLPSSMGVVGAGPIGLELGQALSRLGVKVTVVGRAATAGGLSDPKVAEVAAKVIGTELPLVLGTPARIAVGPKDTVEIRAGGRTWAVEAVLLSLGRQPNVEGLALENTGAEVDSHGVPRFDPHTMQVGALPLFIAGDVNGRAPILHEASDDGRIAGYNSVQTGPKRFQRRTSLEIVFTDPNIALVGKTFAELQSKPFVSGEVSFERQGRARILSRNRGHLCVYAEPRTGKLLGAEMIAPAGEHLAHLLAWAIQRGLTVFDCLAMPFYHPVVEEGLRTALRDLAQKVGPGPSPLELTLAD